MADTWLSLTLAAVFVAVLALLGAIRAAWPDPGPAAATAGLGSLPWPWRIAWPLLRRLAPAFGPLVGVAQRERLRERLGRAGFDRVLGPEQVVAAQCAATILAGVAVALAAWASTMFSLWIAVPAAVLAGLTPGIAIRRRAALRRNAVLKRLPHDLDLITLSIEAGLNLGAALGQAARHGPPGPLRDEWQRVLRDIRAGQPRHEALGAMGVRLALPAVSTLVAALLAAERQGASLGPILRAQAEQRRHERFLRAERLAMEAPVKMLFPLVVCIFPGTFAILLFPVIQQLLREGVL